MSERKCVELTAVYGDGTVARLTESCVVNLCFAHDIPYEAFIVSAETDGAGGTVTRPLRKVTVVRGRYCRASRDGDPQRIEAERGDVEVVLASILPQIIMSDDSSRCDVGPLCDFRITVEAVPVDGKHHACPNCGKPTSRVEWSSGRVTYHCKPCRWHSAPADPTMPQVPGFSTEGEK